MQTWPPSVLVLTIVQISRQRLFLMQIFKSSKLVSWKIVCGRPLFANLHGHMWRHTAFGIGLVMGEMQDTINETATVYILVMVCIIKLITDFIYLI